MKQGKNTKLCKNTKLNLNENIPVIITKRDEIMVSCAILPTMMIIIGTINFFYY